MDGRYDGQMQSHRYATRFKRLPTVEEAIQMTPVTSIVPFNANVFPMPSAEPSTIPKLVFTSEEADRIRQQRNRLNMEASHPTPTSTKLQKTLEDLTRMMNPDDLTKYSFKKPYLRSASKENAQPMATNTYAVNGKVSKRHTPFADLLKKQTTISQQFTVSKPNRTRSSRMDRSSTKQLTSDQAAKSARAFQYSARQNSLPSPKPGSSPRKPSHVAVVIPHSSSQPDFSTFDSDPSADHAVLDAHDGTQIRQHLQDSRRGHDEKAHAALAELDTLADAIFEAEASLDNSNAQDTSGEDQLFTSVQSETGEKWVLTPKTHIQLDSALGKVIVARCMRDVSIDTLTQLQRICGVAAAVSADADLIVPTNAESDDIWPWQIRAESAENSLRAAQILLRVVTAGREEKQLHSEEILTDILKTLTRVVENALVPVVEATAKTYQHLERSQEFVLSSLLQRSTRVLKLLGQLVSSSETSDGAITSTEFLAAKLVFVEIGTSEKDSVIGVQKFEVLRRNAMDVLARIFKRCPNQRRFILDEIVSSLERLPVNRQSARHFKVADSKPIQLVSALIMQLIQSSASSTQNKAGISADTKQDGGDSDADGSADDMEQSFVSGTNISPRKQVRITGDSVTDLKAVALPLFETAQQNALNFTGYLVQRAMTTSKNEQPYRNLLDIFTEDFVNVLGSAEWPAAELLLRALLSRLLAIARDEKSTAPAKVMALDLMGVMGAGIADIQAFVNRSSRSLETIDSPVAKMLLSQAEGLAEGRLEDTDVVGLKGPYRAVVDYLDRKDTGDHGIQSAREFIAVQWSRNSWTLIKPGDAQVPPQLDKAMQWLGRAIADTSIMSDDTQYDVSSLEGRIAYGICALSMPFCKAFQAILHMSLAALTSPHATVRSRGLKSVIQLLEKDPSILKNYPNVLTHILGAANDKSPLVRDSALGLIGKCLTLKHSLEDEVLDDLIHKTADPAVNVRKRAMKLLKDIYLRNKSKDVRSRIADAILQRADDAEESVSELARNTIEEIWLAPFYESCSKSDLTLEDQQRLGENAATVVATAHLNEDVVPVLVTMFQGLLGAVAKNKKPNNNVCRHLIRLIFDRWISKTQAEGGESPSMYLEALTIFAKAKPRLFDASQMRPLKPYIGHLEKDDDLLVYRSVIIIYRCVLPLLPSIEHDFLKDVQGTLLKNIQKLGKLELEEAATCLWIINGVLQDTIRFAKLILSVLVNLQQSASGDFANDQALVNRCKRLLLIAGYLGKVFDFERHREVFKQRFQSMGNRSVSALVVGLLASFGGPNRPETLRQVAVDATCLVCQSWPENFSQKGVVSVLDAALGSDDDRIKLAGLSGVKTYFLLEEQRSKTTAEIPIGMGAATGSERLSKSMLSGNREGATSNLVQRFFPIFKKLALSTTDSVALSATEVVSTITRQGITHPQESCLLLVALETSPNYRIAQMAFEQHKLVHEKHESLLEKDNLKAIETAYEYQRDTVQDVRGFDPDTLSPKLRLFYEVLKAGSPTSRKRLFASLCSRINFNVAKLPSAKSLASSTDYARFVLENLALFDYGRVDEIMQITNTIEKAFSTSGNALSQRIETALNLSTHAAEPEPQPQPQLQPQSQPPQPQSQPSLPLQSDPMQLPSMMTSLMPDLDEPSDFMDTAFPELQQIMEAPFDEPSPDFFSALAPIAQPPQPQPQLQPQPVVSQPQKASTAASGETLQLALAATHLTLMWETRSFLRRLWSLNTAAARKLAIKDASKAPTKFALVNATDYLNRMEAAVAAVQTSDDTALRQVCQSFVELMTIDSDFRAANSDDDGDAARAETPARGGPDDDALRPPASGASAHSNGSHRGRKRKAPATPSKSGGSSKKRRASRSATGRRASRSTDDGADEYDASDAEGDVDDDADLDWGF